MKRLQCWHCEEVFLEEDAVMVTEETPSEAHGVQATTTREIQACPYCGSIELEEEKEIET